VKKEPPPPVRASALARIARPAATFTAGPIPATVVKPKPKATAGGDGWADDGWDKDAGDGGDEDKDGGDDGAKEEKEEKMMSKEEKAAEMARRREERKQVSLRYTFRYVDQIGSNASSAEDCGGKRKAGNERLKDGGSNDQPGSSCLISYSVCDFYPVDCLRYKAISTQTCCSLSYLWYYTSPPLLT